MKNNKPIKLSIFVAIPVSLALQDKANEWEEKFRSKEYSTFNKIRWLDYENLHLTLVPPWNETEEGVLKIKSLLTPISNKKKGFKIKFDNISYGPGKSSPSLIWASGEVPAQLTGLKAYIEKTLKKKSEKRPFALHLTLGRFNPSEFKSFKCKDINEKILWEEKVSEFALMQSNLSPSGAQYTLLDTFKL